MRKATPMVLRGFLFTTHAQYHWSLHFADVENRIESVVLAKMQKREKPVLRVGELGIDNGRGNVVRLKLPFSEKLD